MELQVLVWKFKKEKCTESDFFFVTANEKVFSIWRKVPNENCSPCMQIFSRCSQEYIQTFVLEKYHYILLTSGSCWTFRKLYNHLNKFMKCTQSKVGSHKFQKVESCIKKIPFIFFYIHGLFTWLTNVMLHF